MACLNGSAHNVFDRDRGAVDPEQSGSDPAPLPLAGRRSPRAQLQSGKAVAMPDARELEREALEDHRFFPEWADRPPSTESLHEADRNSYLAGGYAEEF